MSILFDSIIIFSWLYIFFNFSNNKNVKKKAIDNAINIIYIEKKFNFFIEERINNYFFINFPCIIKLFNFYYIFNHYIMLLWFVIYIVTNDKLTEKIKFIFYVGNFISILIHRIYPLMPPRLLNVSTTYGGNMNNYTFKNNSIIIQNNIIENKFNNYSAFPSLHLFHSLCISHCLYNIYNNILVFYHPFLIFLCISITGHHYLIDGIGSTILYSSLYLFYSIISFNQILAI